MKPIYCVVCGQDEVLGREGETGEGICKKCEEKIEKDMEKN